MTTWLSRNLEEGWCYYTHLGTRAIYARHEVGNLVIPYNGDQSQFLKSARG